MSAMPIRCFRSAVTIAFIVGLLATEASAQPTWPTDGQWMAVTSGGAGYGDRVNDIVGTTAPASPLPRQVNIVGDTNYSAGFWYQDTDNVFFRIRIDDQVGPNLNWVWQVYMNTDADDAIEYALQVDNASDDTVELVAATAGTSDSGAADWWNTVGGTELNATPIASVPVADWAQISIPNTMDGSNFNGTPDRFVDMAFPLVSFPAGFPAIEDIQIAFATSQTHILTNKDGPDGVWSDPLAGIPEPSGVIPLAVLFAGFLGVGGWRRLRRKKIANQQ